MSGQISLDGSFTVTPPGSGIGSSFPGGAVNMPMTLTPTPKQSLVRSGPDVRTINSSDAYVTLTGVGDDDAVTKANTLYLRNNGPMMVKLTFDSSPSADIESEFPLYGTIVLECGDTKYLKKVEVKGSGTIEFFVSGNQ